MIREVLILTYHSIDGSGSVLSVHPRDFRAHMTHLAESGFTVLALGDLLDAWDGRRPLPVRPIVLTFDDGFRSVHDQAAPVLKERGFRATVFAVPGHLGGINMWEPTSSPVPRMPLCSAPELLALAREGIEIGAHGFDHHYLPGVPEAGLLRETVTAQDTLEGILGSPVEVYAYPYGGIDPAAESAVRSRYRAGCTTLMGACTPAADRASLPRIDTYYLRNPSLFRLIGSGPGRFYLGLRALGRALRTEIVGVPRFARDRPGP